jgi:RNA polymerase sigma factor (sigma-70 family)
MGALLRARETPEDLMQSVAREVLDDLEGFEWRGEAAFRHWLYVKAQRKLIDRARFVAAERRRPDKEQPLDPVASGAAVARLLDAATPSAAAIGAEEVARIERAFAGLSEEQQEAISLHRLCGMDYTEIAARMQRREAAVRNLVYRGLAKLLLRLGQLRRDESKPDGAD